MSAPPRKRGLSPTVVDEALAADERRRAAIVEFERLRPSRRRWASRSRRRRARRSSSCWRAPRSCRGEVKTAEAAQAEAEAAYREASWRSRTRPRRRPRPAARTTTSCSSTSARRATSRPRASSPATTSSSAGCSARSTSSAGAKVSGARFYYLTGVGADLELALVNMAMDQARGAGFTTMIPPALVKPRAMEGTGFLGQAADDVYHHRGRGPLPGRHVGGAAGGVPLRRDPRRRRRCRGATPRSAPASARRQARTARTPAASSACTGSTRWRCSSYTTLEESYAEHQRLLGWEKEWLAKLELAYRVIDVAAGDLGLSAQRKFDCEAWIPTQGKYRELTSTSNCTDFQARRLDIRGRFGRGRRHRHAARHPQRHARAR